MPQTGVAPWLGYAAAQTWGIGLSNMGECPPRALSAAFASQPDDASSMTAYQGFKLFSHVVLALMLAGIAYASYIAVTYWTGISV